MNKKSIFSAILIGVFSLALAGCGGGNSGGSSTAAYGGAIPIGDYVAVTVDSANSTVTYHNYTTGVSKGPYHFVRISNFNGFRNVYQTTDPFDYSGKTNCHAKFIAMERVALIFQIFDNNNNALDFPVYALARQAVNMGDYKGRAYNWMNFKINDTNGNYEAGFAAFDTDATGHLYGAAYNDRANIESWSSHDKGVKNINDNNISTSVFAYDSGQVANKYGNLTLIGTQCGDFAIDFGPNNGAGFAVRQAASKDWSLNYNGTYLTMVYENRPNESQKQTVEPMRVTFNGAGSFEGAKLGEQTPLVSGTLLSLEDLPNGPHDQESPSYTITEDFERFSGCASALSATVKNAYKCHGGFIAETDGSKVLTFFFEPGGRFFFFNMLENSGPVYRFGFGIKDPNYQQ
ncbi:MAG: hypothetical protein K6U80_09575 [Firmicutes bacterium]|nr:hypothetical protein [Bacillota bacterium]